MESTSNRMSRLGRSLITDTELLSLDRIIAEIDAVEPVALAELAGVLLDPARISAAGIGPDEDRFARRRSSGSTRGSRSRREGRRLRLRGEGRARSSPRGSRPPATRCWASRSGTRSRDGGEAAVDFTQPDAVVGNIEAALERGLPVVVGTTGWDSERERIDALAKERGVAGLRRAELLDRRGADDALRRRGGQAPAAGRDHRAPQRGEEGRAVRAPRGRPRRAWAGTRRSIPCVSPA